MNQIKTFTDEEAMAELTKMAFEDLQEGCCFEFSTTRSNWLVCLKTITSRGKRLAQFSEIKNFVHPKNLTKFNENLGCIDREIDEYRMDHQAIGLEKVNELIEKFSELRLYIDGQVT